MTNKDGAPLQISTLEATILLYHLTRAAQIKEIGFEDADHTLQQLIAILDRPVTVPRAAVESCLWSCNLMDEVGLFWHPNNKTEFTHFVQKLIGPGREFDRMYNFIKERKYEIT